MIEVVKECSCGNQIEPEERTGDNKFYSTTFTEWLCGCGKFSREHETITWKPAFEADLFNTREQAKRLAKMTPKQRKAFKKNMYWLDKNVAKLQQSSRSC